ncbi:MAG: CDP-alcohol phosphatidyltransferase family protein [Polyangiaceae bacterium]
MKGLIHTPITPNQVTLVQPFLAACSGYLISRGDYASTLGAVALFELRSVLDCADGTLARAKNMVSDTGHAIDGFADWLGVMFLYAGITARLYSHPPVPPPSSPGWLGWVYEAPLWVVLLIALLQGALRSFASDFYLQKYGSIFSTGRDETVESLRKRMLALPANPSFFQRFGLFIGQCGQLAFEQRWFDPESTSSDEMEVNNIIERENSGACKMIAALWSVSNGDAFLSMLMITALLDQVWAAQVFFATIGPIWIVGVILLNGWFTRARSAAQVSA